MNLELLNPFTQDYPENFETSIAAEAVCARFNPRGLFAGHFLAVGRSDGVVTVLDFETKGIVRFFEGHVKAVTTVCWSANSRYLLSASRDWNAIIWDLDANASTSLRPERKHTIRFDAPVTSAHLHPRNSHVVIVTLASQVEPVLVDLRNASKGRWELSTVGQGTEEEEEGEDGEEDEENVARKTTAAKEVSTICRFNPTGELAYIGTSQGNINIFDVRTKQFLWSESISNSAIRHLEFDATGTAIVTNGQDRCIRVHQLSSTPPEDSDMDEDEDGDEGTEQEAAGGSSPAPSPAATRPGRVPYFVEQHKFQDLINRTPWNGCAFSRSGECIIGAAGHTGAHSVHVWDRDSGRLNKILEGPKDPCADIDWHPLRPLIASISDTGFVHVWVVGVTENWSAYAPGFEELDENREYREREDEFDQEDELAAKRRRAVEQHDRVDILTPRTKLDAVPAGTFPVNDEYEVWVRSERDGDDNAAFYPPPELLEHYEIEPEPPIQNLGQNGAPNSTTNGQQDDAGYASEELAAPAAVEEKVSVSRAPAKAKKKPQPKKQKTAAKAKADPPTRESSFGLA